MSLSLVVRVVRVARRTQCAARGELFYRARRGRRRRQVQQQVAAKLVLHTANWRRFERRPNCGLLLSVRRTICASAPAPLARLCRRNSVERAQCVLISQRVARSAADCSQHVVGRPTRGALRLRRLTSLQIGSHAKLRSCSDAAEETSERERERRTNESDNFRRRNDAVACAAVRRNDCHLDEFD